MDEKLYSVQVAVINRQIRRIIMRSASTIALFLRFLSNRLSRIYTGIRIVLLIRK